MRRYGTALTLLAAFAFIAATDASAQSIDEWLGRNCVECASLMPEKTGVYILEKGEEALIGRAWLTENAVRTIDVQYFIWSSDNIGTLAAEQFLRAAERGVRVRVLVDDLLVDAENKTLLVLCCAPRTANSYLQPQPDNRGWFLEAPGKCVHELPLDQPAYARQDRDIR